MLQPLPAKLAALLGHRGWIALACALGVALTAGTVDDGLTRDDVVQLHMVRGDDALVPSSKLDLFRTSRGDERLVVARQDAGAYPWFADPSVRLGFFRPLASASHALDYMVAPSHPAWMHLQNLLWFGALIAVAGLLYRRVAETAWVGGLACVLFAVEPSHAGAVGWIAGRNGLMAGVFGLGAVLAHDESVRHQRPKLAYLAAVALLLSLLSGELGLGALAMLISYALWLDERDLRARLRTLAPYLLVVAAWALAWKALGYGAVGSGYYVDPTREPWLFLRTTAWNLPKLGEIVLASAAHVDAPGPLRRWVEALQAPAIVLALPGVWLIIRTRWGRFFATSALLSLVAVCGTMPDGRLVLFASFAAMGLVAGLIAEGLRALGARGRGIPLALRIPLIAALPVMIVFHGILSPAVIPASASAMAARQGRERAARVAAPVPADLRGRELILLNAPHAFVPASWLVAEQQGDPVARSVRGLYFGPGQVTVSRLDDRTVKVSPVAGFLAEPVSWLTRRPGTFPVPGAQFHLSDMSAKVESVTADARPASVVFRFARPVDQERDVWLAWHAGQWYRYAVPAVGESATWVP